MLILTSCIFHSDLIDPQDTFYPILPSFLFSWSKNKYVTLGMGLLWKYIRKSELVHQKWVHFLQQLPNYGEFEAKVKVYNEKNMDFHLTPKTALLVELWGMRIQEEHTTLKIFPHIFKCNSKCKMILLYCSFVLLNFARRNTAAACQDIIPKL